MLGLVEPSGCPLSREELTNYMCHSSAAQTTTEGGLRGLRRMRGLRGLRRMRGLLYIYC